MLIEAKHLRFQTCPLWWCLAVFLSFGQLSAAQSSLLLQASEFSPSDSLAAVSPTETKSTTLAMALSALVPGAGQVYTGRYWKIPIIWGAGIYFGTIWSRANNLYKDARDRYQASLRGGGAGDAQARYERDFYHDERDRFALYLAITYALNIIDAYVGASLYTFDVMSDDLGGNARLQLRIPMK